MKNSEISAGMSVRADGRVGVVRFVKAGQAITEFADGVYPLPLCRLRANPRPVVMGSLVLDALRVYKPLTLRLERGDTLSAQEQEAYRGALRVLSVEPTLVNDYALTQRRLREAMPKVSSEEAHAQARRVLAAAQQQTTEMHV